MLKVTMERARHHSVSKMNLTSDVAKVKSNSTISNFTSDFLPSNVDSSMEYWWDYVVERELLENSKGSNLIQASEFDEAVLKRTQQEESKEKQQRMMLKNSLTARKIKVPDNIVAEISGLMVKHADQNKKIRKLHLQHVKDLKKIEDLEIQLLTSLSRENAALREKVKNLKEKKTSSSCSISSDLSFLNGTFSFSECADPVDETDSSYHTVQEFADEDVPDVDLDVSYDIIHGNCTKFKNSIGSRYAWRSEESLASVSHVASDVESRVASPLAETTETANGSFQFEFDDTLGPRSNKEDFSEGDTSSSGFSEGELSDISTPMSRPSVKVAKLTKLEQRYIEVHNKRESRVPVNMLYYKQTSY